MRLLAVADDLTGAMGLAGRWAGRSAAVNLARRPEALKGLRACLVLDAGTRFLGPAAASAAVRRAWAALPVSGLRFQKIDSTLRGNPGEEIAGLAQACAAPWVAVLPAYPALGRQVLQGRVWVRGQRLDRSEYSRDPLTPSRAAGPAALFPPRLSAHAPLRAVAGGPGALRTWLKRALKSRPRYVSFDCAEPEHVAHIARACLGLGCQAYAGAADLGGALARLQLGPARPVKRPSGSWLILAGSLSATSFAQLARLKREGWAWEALRSRRAGAWQKGAPAGALAAALKRRGGLALSSLGGRRELRAWRAACARRGQGASACAAAAMRELARWGLDTARRGGARGVFATGGHTLAALFDAAGWKRVRVLGEVLPEVPLARTLGGGPPRWVCSKPGGFGEESSFTEFLGGHG